MSAFYESLKTKFELVIICLTLAGMMATGIYVYSSQTLQINDHEKKLHQIEARADRITTEAEALETVITATVIPSLNGYAKDLVAHSSRIETMERNARADRELLIEIRNDLKWMRERIGE